MSTTSRGSKPIRQRRSLYHSRTPKRVLELGEPVHSFHWDALGGTKINATILVVPGYSSLFTIQFRDPGGALIQSGAIQMFDVTMPDRSTQIYPCGGTKCIQQNYYLRPEGKYRVYDSELSRFVRTISFQARHHYDILSS